MEHFEGNATVTEIRNSVLTRRVPTEVCMKIIPIEEMRRAGWGDWQLIDGVLQVRAVEMPEIMSSHLILLHEYREAVRCIRDGISEKQVDRWDDEHHSLPGVDEPGDLPGCPYRPQHHDAMVIEQVACGQDGLDWYAHNNSEPVRRPHGERHHYERNLREKEPA